MAYKIIGDSCSDFTPEMKKNPIFTSVPLTLEIGTYSVVDDENFDQKAFLHKVATTSECPKTACPSPEAFQKVYEAAEADEIFVVTLSQHLSGTYQSAVIGKQMFEDENKESSKRIHVFSSDSAAAGQLNLCIYIDELKRAGASFDEVVEKTEAKIKTMVTCFVLETLDFLKKNGRLSGLQAFFATALNIKPIMGAEGGTIIKLDQERGINKALKKMCKLAVAQAGETKGKRLCISQCNCPERAAFVKAEFEKLADFQEVVISETMGVATVYAGDGGIVIAL